MQALQSSLEPGDVVSTTSGLRGTVVDASYEDTIDLEIADGVVTTWVRAAIRERITTDEPAHEAAQDAGAARRRRRGRPAVAGEGGPAQPGEGRLHERVPAQLIHPPRRAPR